MPFENKTVATLQDLTDTASFMLGRMANSIERIEFLQKEKSTDYIVVNDYADRATRRSKNIARKKYLASLNYKSSGKPCTCGEKHCTVVFVDNENIVEELCPKRWWISLQHLAFLEGKATEFVNELPLRLFLSIYGRENE